MPPTAACKTEAVRLVLNPANVPPPPGAVKLELLLQKGHMPPPPPMVEAIVAPPKKSARQSAPGSWTVNPIQANSMLAMARANNMELQAENEQLKAKIAELQTPRARVQPIVEPQLHSLDDAPAPPVMATAPSWLTNAAKEVGLAAPDEPAQDPAHIRSGRFLADRLTSGSADRILRI